MGEGHQGQPAPGRGGGQVRRKNAGAGCLLCKPWKANNAKGKRPAKEQALRDEAMSEGLRREIL
ncbi:MAG: hypothetical protein HY922_10540 [Elusimicrobia bacterium]|nr:hypothetical protein [Elusimicrobiota bacterium]